MSRHVIASKSAYEALNLNCDVFDVVELHNRDITKYKISDTHVL